MEYLIKILNFDAIWDTLMNAYRFTGLNIGFQAPFSFVNWVVWLLLPNKMKDNNAR